MYSNVFQFTFELISLIIFSTFDQSLGLFMTSSTTKDCMLESQPQIQRKWKGSLYFSARCSESFF